MKKFTICIAVITLLLFTLTTKAQMKLPPLTFEKGAARISGFIRCDKPVEGLTLKVVVKDIFQEQPDFYSTRVLTDGSFRLTIPLATNNALASMLFSSDSANYAPGMLLELSQTKETLINAVLKDGQVSSQTSGALNLTTDDRAGYPEAVFKFDTAEGELSGVAPTAYDMPLADYVTWQWDSILPKRISYALETVRLSPGMRTFLVNALRMRYASGRMFTYVEDARRRYKRTVQDPPVSYYSFLKTINLNPETALYETNYYPVFMKRFLKIKAFGIPPVSDMPVTTWIQNVKMKVEKTIGTKEQTFYDVLALYAYLNDNRTLSVRQKQNIAAYYTGKRKGMGTALLNHYAGMDSIFKNNKHDLRFNATPRVGNQKVMDEILSKYPGKTVLVDIWGTWCQPCMVAHKAMAGIKDELRKQGIVFVYLADTSSPVEKWRNKATEIGDEHYYLTRPQINAIFAQYKERSNPYPFYLIFDKQHKLIQKFAGFPGTETIVKVLQGLPGVNQ